MRQRFTGQERDDDTTLDYFLARYYSGTQGRFGSPDPGNAGANPGDPQSWNGYAYVSGNPLTYTDPSGQFLSATAVGAAAGGPVGAAIGAAIDVGLILLGIFDGGSTPDLSSAGLYRRRHAGMARFRSGDGDGDIGADVDPAFLALPGLAFQASKSRAPWAKSATWISGLPAGTVSCYWDRA